MPIMSVSHNVRPYVCVFVPLLLQILCLLLDYLVLTVALALASTVTIAFPVAAAVAVGLIGFDDTLCPSQEVKQPPVSGNILMRMVKADLIF